MVFIFCSCCARSLCGQPPFSFKEIQNHLKSVTSVVIMAPTIGEPIDKATLSLHNLSDVEQATSLSDLLGLSPAKNEAGIGKMSSVKTLQVINFCLKTQKTE